MIKDVPDSVKFLTGGLGGIFGWILVHPVNTLATRMNLYTASKDVKQMPGVIAFAKQIVREEGWRCLYNGLSAGITRQIFYATSRLGLFEVFRNFSLNFRDVIDFKTRLICGILSGACAAVISCPAEVSLVRMSNDNSLPPSERRNYKGVHDAAFRIAKEEGYLAFWRGCMPFVNRAMLVGVFQVGTNDQFKEFYNSIGVKTTFMNTFCSAMSAGFIYSLVTMPFESAKNRMAFQKKRSSNRSVKVQIDIADHI